MKVPELLSILSLLALCVTHTAAQTPAIAPAAASAGGASSTSVKLGNLDQQKDALLETYDSLKTPPRGAVELKKGNYRSVMLDKPCPFRVFSPVDPKWSTLKDEDRIASEGMRLVVYVMNLKGIARPSAADDRAIIEGLIKDGFLVVTVDFMGGRIKNHLELQKDISSLFCMFGGEWHAQQSYFTENRKTLLQYPGPNQGSSFTSFSYSRNSSMVEIPVNRAAIYVIPSGYTVEAHLVFKDNLPRQGEKEDDRKTLFMDIVYPKASRKTDRVPILLEGSSTGTGEFVVNANTPVLYSWLFNGYAFASMCFVKPVEGDHSHSLIHGLRYLQSQKARFSLSGKIGTAGISKSSRRCYFESNFRNQASDVDKEPYGNESSRVLVCMPAVGRYDRTVWENLDEDSPVLVLSWCHLNGDGKSNGDEQRSIREAYKKAGIADKCLYLSSPMAGHEYDIYHLTEIMEFFDKHCK